MEVAKKMTSNLFKERREGDETNNTLRHAKTVQTAREGLIASTITAKMKRSSLEILIGTKNVTSRVIANIDRPNVAMHTLIKWVIALNATNGDTCRQSAKRKTAKIEITSS